MGIQDRKVLRIISKMVKTEVEGEGIPDKGTPQGGVLSPLLSNIVLNDLDQWVAGQWEDFVSKYSYARNDGKYVALKKTRLKEGYIVRYADDFKVLCRDWKTAQKWYHAVRLYLKDRLKLDISPEKSQILNLRKRPSEFLGFTVRAVKKGRKRVALATRSCTTALFWGYTTTSNERIRSASNSHVLPVTYARTSIIVYCKSANMNIQATRHVRMYSTANFNQNISPFTEEGRDMIRKKLQQDIQREVSKLMKSNIPNRSIEYMDNRISRYSMKRGKCEITGMFLYAEDVHCHHYLPTSLGGSVTSLPGD